MTGLRHLVHAAAPPLSMEEARMGCVTVCGVVEGGALADAVVVALAAFAVAVLAVGAVAVVSVVASFAWVATLVILAAIPPAIWLLVRVNKYGPTCEVLRRHPVRPPRMRAPRQTALPAGVSLRALPAPQPPLEGVIIGTRERTGHERA